MNKLFHAILSLDPSAVKQALASGEDVNARAGNEWTPLHAACRQCYLTRLSEPAARIVEILLASGADATLRDSVYMLAADYCEGYSPQALRARMFALAEADAWPCPDPGSDYHYDADCERLWKKSA